MRWFKHDVDCEISEGLSYLISVSGFAGYGRWFRVLEIVASKMDKSDRCHAEYPIQKWCSLLGLKQKKLISFLELTENKLKTKVVYSGNIIRIEIPNLLNKRDEYSNRSGQNRDNIRYKNKDIRDKIEDITTLVLDKSTPCPHQEIINLYHQKLPDLASVKIWTEKRKAVLKSRWVEEPDRQCLEWWENYFNEISLSDFLTGRVNGNGKKPFKADLEWMINQSNMVKILEGKYSNVEKSIGWQDRLEFIK
jgi:hypothetical protein